MRSKASQSFFLKFLSLLLFPLLCNNLSSAQKYAMAKEERVACAGLTRQFQKVDQEGRHVNPFKCARKSCLVWHLSHLRNPINFSLRGTLREKLLSQSQCQRRAQWAVLGAASKADYLRAYKTVSEHKDMNCERWQKQLWGGIEWSGGVCLCVAQQSARLCVCLKRQLFICICFNKHKHAYVCGLYYMAYVRQLRVVYTHWLTTTTKLTWHKASVRAQGSQRCFNSSIPLKTLQPWHMSSAWEIYRACQPQRILQCSCMGKREREIESARRKQKAQNYWLKIIDWLFCIAANALYNMTITHTRTHTHTPVFKHSPLAQHETNAHKMNLLLRFLLLLLLFFFLLLLLLLKSMQKAFKPCCLCLGAVMWQQQPQKLSAQKDWWEWSVLDKGTSARAVSKVLKLNNS